MSNLIKTGGRPKPPIDSSCQLCTRIEALSFHHLIPRKQQDNTWFRREFSREEMRTRGAWLCRGFHQLVHHQFDENRLGRTLNTLEKLREEPLIARHIAWASERR